MAEGAENPKENIEYKIDYRDVKYPRLEFKTGSLLLILPRDYGDEEAILEKHREWIQKKEQTIKRALEESKEKDLNYTRTEEELKNIVKTIVERYREEFNLEINGIYFRRMKTKWGSYSQKRNLTINTLLKHLPQKLIEYVIYHELTHSRERRHNERFWKLIRKKFQDYQKREEDLLIHWFLTQKSINQTNR